MERGEDDVDHEETDLFVFDDFDDIGLPPGFGIFQFLIALFIQLDADGVGFDFLKTGINIFN